MDSKEFLRLLNDYKKSFNEILRNFKKDSAGLWIHQDDDPIYRQKVQEVIDLINDTIGDKTYGINIINQFSDGLSNFYQSPSFKSVENISGIIGALIKRVERNPELLNRNIKIEKVKNKDNKSIDIPDKITLKWLLNNIDITLLGKIISIFIFVFLLGAYLSGIPKIKKVLSYLPGYKVGLIIPDETRNSIETQIDILISSHNDRLAELQKQLLSEEKLSADHNLLSAYRQEHFESASRIKNLIKDENEIFEKQIRLLKSILE